MRKHTLPIRIHTFSVCAMKQKLCTWIMSCDQMVLVRQTVKLSLWIIVKLRQRFSLMIISISKLTWKAVLQLWSKA